MAVGAEAAAAAAEAAAAEGKAGQEEVEDDDEVLRGLPDPFSPAARGSFIFGEQLRAEYAAKRAALKAGHGPGLLRRAGGRAERGGSGGPERFSQGSCSKLLSHDTSLFPRLVLFCINADLCVQRRIFQHSALKINFVEIYKKIIFSQANFANFRRFCRFY